MTQGKDSLHREREGDRESGESESESESQSESESNSESVSGTVRGNSPKEHEEGDRASLTGSDLASSLRFLQPEGTPK